MSSKSDKPLVRNWIIGTLAAIILFHLLWAKYTWRMDSATFYVADIALLLLYGITARIAYKEADDPMYDKYRYIFIIFTAAILVWVGIWSSSRMMNVLEGLA
jgi:hypothetical protein